MIRITQLMVALSFVLIQILVLSLCPTSSLCADLFRWVDEKGIIHFTDNMHSIPEPQRGKATRIKGSDAPRSREASRPASPEKASVPFQKRGAVVIVQATVNEKASARFVVDTGASYTLISQATAKELDIDLDGNLPKISLQTANGVITAPLVSLDSIEVGGMQVKNLTAAVYNVFTDPGISGLLGLNFLSHFRMDIDTQNGILHLEKK